MPIVITASSAPSIVATARARLRRRSVVVRRRSSSATRNWPISPITFSSRSLNGFERGSWPPKASVPQTSSPARRAIADRGAERGQVAGADRAVAAGRLEHDGAVGLHHLGEVERVAGEPHPRAELVERVAGGDDLGLALADPGHDSDREPEQLAAGLEQALDPLGEGGPPVGGDLEQLGRGAVAAADLLGLGGLRGDVAIDPQVPARLPLRDERRVVAGEDAAVGEADDLVADGLALEEDLVDPARELLRARRGTPSPARPCSSSRCRSARRARTGSGRSGRTRAWRARPCGTRPRRGLRRRAFRSPQRAARRPRYGAGTASIVRAYGRPQVFPTISFLDGPTDRRSPHSACTDTLDGKWRSVKG